TSELHYRRVADPHGLDDGGPGRIATRNARRGANHRHGLEIDGLRNRAVWQESPGIQEPVSAHCARLRRVLRLPVPPGRDGGSVSSELPTESEGVRGPAKHGPQLGYRHG